MVELVETIIAHDLQFNTFALSSCDGEVVVIGVFDGDLKVKTLTSSCCTVTLLLDVDKIEVGTIEELVLLKLVTHD